MPLSRRTFLNSFLAALAGCRRTPTAGFQGYVFVANEEGQAVAAVDLGSFSLLRRIAVDGSPTAVISHPSLPVVYALTPATGTVHEIAADSLALRRKARVAQGAVSMRLSPDGGRLWVICREPRRLAGVDLETFRPAAHVTLPAEPVDFDLSPGGRLCAVSFGRQGTVTMFDPAGGRAGRSIYVSGEAGTVRFRSDGRHLLVADLADRRLSILETPTGRVVVHLPLAVRPENFCFKADGGQLFITGAGMDAVVIVYPYSTEVAETVLAGRAPGAMAVSRSPEYLFVANPQSGDVTIVDVETHRVIAAVSVGADPGFITVTPDSQYALVLNRRSGNIAVLRVPDIVPTRRRSAALFTVIPVGSRPVSAAVKAV